MRFAGAHKGTLVIARELLPDDQSNWSGCTVGKGKDVWSLTSDPDCAVGSIGVGSHAGHPDRRHVVTVRDGKSSYGMSAGETTLL